MPDLLKQYPGVQEQLDPDLSVVSAQVSGEGDAQTLRVVQRGEYESGEVDFAHRGGSWVLSEDEPSSLSPDVSALGVESCGASSKTDHDAVESMMKSKVGWDTSDGPDGGNLACAWAVRHLVHDALKRWITRSDYTPTVHSELQSCFGEASDESDVPNGGIIISPTAMVKLPNGKRIRRIGHIGLLGSGSGGTRLIYSNKSSTARWAQSHTIDKWKSYYGGRGLKVLYYPLPHKGAQADS